MIEVVHAPRQCELLFAGWVHAHTITALGLEMLYLPSDLA